MENRSRNIRRNRLLFGLTLLVALCGIFLPGQVLNIQGEAAVDQVLAVPEDAYSSASSAMARNASANLGLYEKLQLITGEWESTRGEAASYEMELQDYEAAEAARDGLKRLCDAGLYPESVTSDYGDWYTWQAKPLKALDTTFHTYTAYYWEITFVRYDRTRRHTVFLLEDGTVFLAEAELRDGVDGAALSDTAAALSGRDDLAVTVQNPGDRTPAALLPYYEGEADGLQWKSLAQLTSDGDSYCAVQAISENRYLFAVGL